jgi:putrescine aminotransferase
MHEDGWIPIPGIVHIDQPYQLEHGLPGESEQDFALRAASWLEDKIKAMGADNIAAFVAEPVQMAGGAIIPPPGYWQKIQEICRRYDILLVSDDVICSFGRLGTWFGFEHPRIDIQPDLIVIAKAVTNAYFPLAGVILGKRVGDALVDSGGDFNHGFTYSGHPVGAAVAIATIRLMQDTDILQKLQTTIIPYFSQAFKTLNDHPLIDHAETLGMMAGFVLYQDKAKRIHFPKEQKVAALCQQICYQHGVAMRPAGTRMACAPPLIINEAQIDEMIVKIRNALDATLKAVAL